MKSKKIPEEKINPRKRMKPKAMNSFSIPKKCNSCTTMAKQHLSQKKTWRKETAYPTDETSSTSTNTNSSTSCLGEDESEAMEIAIASCIDDDGWETETSIEMMRSSELTSVDESVIPPPLSFRDKDIASLVFLSESYCPIAYSTPRSIPNGKSFPFSVKIDSIKEAVPPASPTWKSDVVTRHEELPTIPNVSFENEFVKEKDTLEGENIEMKSISPEQSVQLLVVPDIVSSENQEQNEGEDIEMKSISPEPSLQLPVVSNTVVSENQQQCEGRPRSNETEDLILSPFRIRNDEEGRDSLIFPGVPFSACSDISQDSNASTLKLKEDQILSPFKKHDAAEGRDLIFDFEVPYFGGSDISYASDAPTLLNFEENEQYSENNPFEAIVNKSTNSNSRNRQEEDEMRNLFEDYDDYSSGEGFGKFLNLKIDSSIAKLKCNKVRNRMNESITRWKQRNEGVNLLEYRSNSEDNIENVQKIQTTEPEDNKSFNNHQPQTDAPQIKSGVNVSVGVNKKIQQEKDTDFVNTSQNSISLRIKPTNDDKHLFEDKNKNDSEDSSKTIEYALDENFQHYESVNNQQETATQQKTTKRITFAGILSELRDSNEKRKNVIGSSEDADDHNKLNNFEKDETPVDELNRLNNFEKDETPKRKGRQCKRSKLKFSQRIKTPRRRKNRNERGNLFKDVDMNEGENLFKDVDMNEGGNLFKDVDMNEGGNLFKDVGMNDSGGLFGTDQNEQNELQDDELDNSRPGASTYRTNRKINKNVGTDNITQKDTNISQSYPSLKEKRGNEEENWFQDMGVTASEDNFDHFQNEPYEELHQDDESDHNIPETSAHQIKRKNNIHVGSDNMKQQNDSISNKSQDSARRTRKPENEEENSLGDLDKTDNDKSSENIQENRNDGEKAGNSFEETHGGVDDFEEVHNVEVNTSKRKRKPFRSVGRKKRVNFSEKRKPGRSVNRSRNAAYTLSRSNSTSREVSAENTNWPRCCIGASSVLRRTFRVLSPVFNDDYPIDSITLFSYDLRGNQKKCKH